MEVRLTSNVGYPKKKENNMLQIADKKFSSRLFTGTGKFSSSKIMKEALLTSESELVTVALKRVDVEDEQDDILQHLNHSHINLLPNTSGVRTAKEAVFAAQLSREALETNWVKLEIHPDPKYLLPDPIETLKAATELVNKCAVHRSPQGGAASTNPVHMPINSTSAGGSGREVMRAASMAVNQLSSMSSSESADKSGAGKRVSRIRLRLLVW